MPSSRRLKGTKAISKAPGPSKVYVKAGRPHTRVMNAPKSPNSRNVFPAASENKLDLLDDKTIAEVIQHGKAGIAKAEAKLKAKSRGEVAQATAAGATSPSNLKKYFTLKTTGTGPSTPPPLRRVPAQGHTLWPWAVPLPIPMRAIS